MAEQKFNDLELVAALTLHEGNITKTAAELGVTRGAVIKRKKTLPEGIITKDVDTFRQKRADIFASLQQILLQHITPKKLKTASLAQIGTLFGIMYDKERLERNLATDYIAHAHFKALSPEQMKAIRSVSKEMTERKLKEVVYDKSL